MKEIEEILRGATEKNQHQIDWTKAWSGKYPVLKSYQESVDIPRYAGELRRLLGAEQSVSRGALPVFGRATGVISLYLKWLG